MKYKLGWLKDYSDIRDYSPDHSEVKPLLSKLKYSSTVSTQLPANVDLRDWMPPVEDQESLGSCTANAGVGLIEYFERRAFGKHIDASRLFLYKTTRNFMQITGDTGASLRSTMAAMVLFGVAPERYWPYNIEDFDIEPSAFCYGFASNYQAIKYFNLDNYRLSPDATLVLIKRFLNAGFPSMFGFTVYSSINQADDNGKIPYPVPQRDSVRGGHALVAAGYDDKIKIKNSLRGGIETKGAFLIRNSWGTDWGEDGYGWLPYDYLKEGRLASDWWSLIKSEFINTDQFRF